MMGENLCYCVVVKERCGRKKITGCCEKTQKRCVVKTKRFEAFPNVSSTRVYFTGVLQVCTVTYLSTTIPVYQCTFSLVIQILGSWKLERSTNLVADFCSI